LAKIYNHNVETSNIPAYSSSNSSVLTVDNVGLVRAVDIGNAIITVGYKGTSRDMSIESIDSGMVNKYPVLDTAAYLYVNQTKTFNVHYEDNGVEFEDTCAFTVFGSDGISSSGLVEIVSQDAENNSCLLRSGDEIGVFVLKVKN